VAIVLPRPRPEPDSDAPDVQHPGQRRHRRLHDPVHANHGLPHRRVRQLRKGREHG
jgi:hypothetical protein